MTFGQIDPDPSPLRYSGSFARNTMGVKIAVSGLTCWRMSRKFIGYRIGHCVNHDPVTLITRYSVSLAYGTFILRT